MHNHHIKVITIDGPAGSGKSTVANLVAKELKWIYVTTGAIYRALAFLLKTQGIDRNDTQGIVDNITYLNKNYRQDTCTGQVFLGDKEISHKIKSPEISELASIMASDALVRKNLLDLQRDVVLSANGAVVDGRDIGTVVFPQAPLKIFLTASPEARAQRRVKELAEKGTEVRQEEILKEIFERDKRDQNREESPTRPAEDAILIDSTALSPMEITKIIVDYSRERKLSNS